MKRLLFLSFLSLNLIVFGQNKYGYIDMDYAMQQLPEYKQAENELNLLSEHYEDSINRITKAYYKMIETGIPHHLYPDSAEIAKFEKELQTMQIEIELLQQNAYNEILSYQEKLQIYLMDLISLDLKEFGNSINISCLMDKNTLNYCPDCTDYTPDFIQYLSEKHPVK